MNSSTLNKPKAPETTVPSAFDSPAPTYQPQPTTTSARQGSTGSWWLFNVALPLAILAAGGLTILLLGEKAVPTKPPIDQSLAARVERLPDVQTLPVRSMDAVGGTLDLSVDGEVVPHREMQIATEVAGQVVYKSPLCEVGNFVNEGELLFRIDPTDYQNEVERLTKLKEQEYQAIRELEQEEVNTRRLIEVATRDVELRDREISRLKALPSGVASQSELDQSQRSRLQALNTKVTLENQMDLMRQRRARLEAAEQLAATQLAMAETNLKRTEIRSPASGVIFREDAEINSFVQRGQVIVTIEDTSKAEIVINLRTDQLFWILDQNRAPHSVASAGTEISTGATLNTGKDYMLPKTPATIQFSLAGRDNEVLRWKGTLVRYDGIGFDPASRTVPVRVVVDNPRRVNIADEDSEQTFAAGPTALVRGMFVTVVLHVQPKRPLVIIPAVALKPGESGNRLWKFQPDESVLDEAATPEVGAGDSSVSTDSSSPAGEGQVEPAQLAGAEAGSTDAEEASKEGEKEVIPFDPEQWVVGRVEVLQRVRPIESVTLDEAAVEDGKIAQGGNGKTTYWICEIGQGRLEPGDRLIVSPLPTFEGKGRDGVRAPNK